MRTMVSIGSLLVLTFAQACGNGGSSGPDARNGFDATVPVIDAKPPPRTEFGGARPATLFVPDSYDEAVATPLVLALHGYTTDGLFIRGYTGFNTLFQTAGFLLIAPDGKVDTDGERFWNATDACCDLFNDGVDDVAYLRGLISDIREDYNVDPKRIYLIGHSNGAFMTYRMACEDADVFAALISFAGATFKTPADCAPSEPVSVLQIHGDLDGTIAYAGASTGGPNMDIPFPGAIETVQTWATYDGCNTTLNRGTPMDFTGNSSETTAETDVDSVDGCPTGIGAELWTNNGGTHVLLMKAASKPLLWDWLAAHPKP